MVRRITFGQWLKVGSEAVKAEYFVNNHYAGVVERGVEHGLPYASTAIGTKLANATDVVKLSELL